MTSQSPPQPGDSDTELRFTGEVPAELPRTHARPTDLTPPEPPASMEWEWQAGGGLALLPVGFTIRAEVLDEKLRQIVTIDGNPYPIKSAAESFGLMFDLAKERAAESTESDTPEISPFQAVAAAAGRS